MIDQIKTILHCSYETAGAVKQLILEDKTSTYALTKIAGIGPQKASVLRAVLDLGKLIKEEKSVPKKRINCSSDALIYFQHIEDLEHEEFWTLLLNRCNSIIERIKISQGGYAGTVTEVSMIARHAINQKAQSIILAHNHPSGNLKPSEADISITQKIKEGLKYFDIMLLDHLIVSPNGYLSMADEGLL